MGSEATPHRTILDFPQRWAKVAVGVLEHPAAERNNNSAIYHRRVSAIVAVAAISLLTSKKRTFPTQ